LRNGGIAPIVVKGLGEKIMVVMVVNNLEE